MVPCIDTCTTERCKGDAHTYCCLWSMKHRLVFGSKRSALPHHLTPGNARLEPRRGLLGLK